MSYHILEVRKVDKDGRELQHQYFIVDAAGNVIPGLDGGPFATIEMALNTLERLTERDKALDSPDPEQHSYSRPGM